MQTIQFITGATVTLVEVERDDDQFVIGTTNTGKRLVAPRASLVEPVAEFEPAVGDSPTGQHPYRVYLRNGSFVRIVAPPFATMEDVFVGNDSETTYGLRTADSQIAEIRHDQIVSILSPTPDDQAVAERQASMGASA